MGTAAFSGLQVEVSGRAQTLRRWSFSKSSSPSSGGWQSPRGWRLPVQSLRLLALTRIPFLGSCRPPPPSHAHQGPETGVGRHQGDRKSLKKHPDGMLSRRDARLQGWKSGECRALERALNLESGSQDRVLALSLPLTCHTPSLHLGENNSYFPG